MAIDCQVENRVMILTINRPEALNALNIQARRELNKAMIDFRDDPNLWVAIITGAGNKAFSVGGDIKEKLSHPGPGELEAGVAQPIRADQIWKPFIAAINGYALGGGLELALTCDLRIAAEHARFGQPEIFRGFLPGGGATQRLPRFIPRAKAVEMLIMGRQIDAREAQQIGLVNQVVPLDQLIPTAKEWAEIICQAAPLAVGDVKKALIKGFGLPLEEGLQLERSLRVDITDTEDFKEGIKAFNEKRKPVWKAR